MSPRQTGNRSNRPPQEPRERQEAKPREERPLPRELMVYENPEALRKDLSAAMEQLHDVLPRAVDPDRFLRVVSKAVIESPKLMACTRISILAAIHEAAQLGLEPTGLLGSAYLVPYRNRREVNGQWITVHEASLIPGYRGLIDLARRSGEIDAIEAELVYAKDYFRLIKGSGARIEHEPFIPNPNMTKEERVRGPIVGAYMKATLRGGHEQYEWMTIDEIDAIRARSKAKDDGPWVTDYPEMCRKTVVRRGSKYLPLTTEFRRALELDEEAERNAERNVTPVAPMPKATEMLLQRDRDRAAAAKPVNGEGDPGPQEPASPAPSQARETAEGDGVVIEGTGQEVREATKPQEEEHTGEICGAISEDLGECGRPKGHEAKNIPHGNDNGVWPLAKPVQDPQG